MTKLIKISEAAKVLGVTRQRMYQLIGEGRVQVIELYGIKLVDEEKLDPNLIKRGRENPMKKSKRKTLKS